MAVDLEKREALPRHDNQNPDLFGQTPSQTVGPYFHYGLPWKGGADLLGQSEIGPRLDLVPPEHFVLNTTHGDGLPRGEAIEIKGVIVDADGTPIPDAMVEIWQANAAGRYNGEADTREDVPLDPHFIGFGRAAASAEGVYQFRTIRPGRVPGPGNTLQAPHLAVSVFGRGLLKRLATRLYFADGEGLETDPILSLVPEKRRHTLLAQKREGAWWFPIHLAGNNETVFFDL